MREKPLIRSLEDAPYILKKLPGEVLDAIDFTDPVVREMAAAAGKCLPLLSLNLLAKSELIFWAHFAAARAAADPLYASLLDALKRELKRRGGCND